VGKNPEQLGPDDLAPLDEVHFGGRTATEAVTSRLGLQRGMRVLGPSLRMRGDRD
jgi:hypothetical protein